MLKDWIQFDILDTTKFDLAMSSGYALIGANRMKAKKQEKKEQITDVRSIFRIYA